MTSVAAEHVLWCTQEHVLWRDCPADYDGEFSPRGVIESIGLGWTDWKEPSWEDAVFAIQVARTRLMRKQLRDLENETRRMQRD